MKIFKYLLITILVLVSTIVVYLFTLNPSNEKQWDEQFAVSTNIKVDGENYNFKNVRGWQWDKNGVVKKEYINKTYNINNLENVWFLLQPFDNNKRLAHTFLIFDFKNGETVSLSIEARREKGEKYNGLLGAFKKYEIMYMWGTERDFIGKRAVYDNQTIYMYPLKVNDNFKKELFKHLVNKTNKLYTESEFYNTLTSNCTNSLAKVANQVTPKTVPINISWWLTGLSDNYLYKLGYINTSLPQDKIRQKYTITEFAKDNIESNDFSSNLRIFLLEGNP